jgi:hypothetical protein
MTGVAAVSCKHYKLYRPRLSQLDLDDGWRSLGHSFNSSKALIVKVAEDHQDAIHRVTATRLSWRSKSFFVSDPYRLIAHIHHAHSILTRFGG